MHDWKRVFWRSATAGMALALASQAYAQQARATGAAAAALDDQDALGGIVVTANKREENLNDVGMSVTALSARDIQSRGITTLEDVAASVPGLVYTQSQSNTPVFTLRGIGFNESSVGVYPAVSVYADQAPLPFPVLAAHTAYDLERIEVLKGPQGTLFGQNSTGGAINYIVAKPTSRFEYGGDISVGRFNRVEGNAYISGPLSDTLGARLAITALNADAWQISNTRPSDRNGKQSYVAGRLVTEWEATSALRFSLNVNGWIDKSDPQALQLVAVRPGVPDVATQRVLDLLAAVPFTRESARSADWSTGVYEPRSKQWMVQAALRTDLDLGSDLTLTSLTSYVRYKRNQTADGDGTYLVSIDFPIQDAKINSFNQELRLSNAPSSAFRWVLGANLEKSKTYEYQELNFTDQTNNNPSNLNISESGDRNRQDILNYAFFGNGEYDVTDQLTLRAGVRYTRSRIDNDNCIVATDGPMRDLFNFLGGLLGSVPFTPIQIGDCLALNDNSVPNEEFSFNLKQDNMSWRVGADYKLAADTLLYANVSRGYKAGSFPTLAASTFVQLRPVTQEQVTSYEAGLKTTLWDGKAQLNVSAFYSDYRDKQIKGKLLDGIFNILDALVNVPKSRIKGVETELTLRPVSGLKFSGSLTYLRSKIQRHTGVNVIGENQNFAGGPLPFTPKWSYAADLEYRHRSSGHGTPFVGIAVHGQSESDAALGGGSFEFPDSPLVRLAPGLKYVYHNKPFTVVDLRLGYEAENGNWRVMLWGKNVFDKYYWTNVIPALDTSARLAGRPATYGVTFGVNFR